MTTEHVKPHFVSILSGEKAGYVPTLKFDGKRGIIWYSTVRGGREMAVHWKKDIDAALGEARDRDRPLLLDFSATPG